MNDETVRDDYHEFSIEGQRENPTRGDYERWWFRVTNNDGVRFTYAVRLSRSQAAVRRLNTDDALNRLLKDTGLRRIHGMIDLEKFPEGEPQEFLIHGEPEDKYTLSEEEIQLQILKVLAKLRRLDPVRARLQNFDVSGFCEILGITFNEYIDNAVLLRDEGYVADSELEQKTIEKGGLYITAQGLRYLKQLQAPLVRNINERRIHIDDIDSLAKVRDVGFADVTHMLKDGYLDYSEEHIQIALEEILHEKLHKKDWGGETNDLYSANLIFQGERVPTAFLLKGNGLKKLIMRLADCGKNGDQVLRLFDAPASLFVIQFVGNIDENVIRDAEGKVAQKRAIGHNAWYCIINGQDTARILVAYNKLKK